jgi:hypothetical protein
LGHEDADKSVCPRTSPAKRIPQAEGGENEVMMPDNSINEVLSFLLPNQKDHVLSVQR